MPKKFLERFKKIDYLIGIRGTGTPAQLATKQDISESMVYEYLNVLRDQGAPIAYDKERQSYFMKKMVLLKLFLKNFGNSNVVGVSPINFTISKQSLDNFDG